MTFNWNIIRTGLNQYRATTGGYGSNQEHNNTLIAWQALEDLNYRMIQIESALESIKRP